MGEFKDYLSKENCNCIRGIFAVVILVHHIAQLGLVKVPYYVDLLLQSTGYLAVSIFFFLSGYGLAEQDKRQKDYLKHFGRNRMLPIYGMYLYVWMLYLLFFLIIGRQFTIEEILRSLVIYPTFVNNGWFFFAIIIIYSLFWLVYTFIKNPTGRIVGVVIGLAAFCFVGYFLKYWTYISVFAFPMGMVWQYNKTRIDAFAERRDRWVCGMTGSVVLFCVFFLPANMYRLPEWCYMACRTLSAVFFVNAVMWACIKIPVSNRITKFLGEYSPYIYAMQGMILYGLANCTEIRNPVAFTLLAVLGTLFLAVMTQKVWGMMQGIRIKQH